MHTPFPQGPTKRRKTDNCGSKQFYLKKKKSKEIKRTTPGTGRALSEPALPIALPGSRAFCRGSSCSLPPLFLGQQPASILPHLLSKPAPQSSQVCILTSASEKGRTSGSTRPTDPLPGTLSKHAASPDFVCPVSTKETAQAVCQRSTRARGLRGGGRQGWWCVSTRFTALTADCHATGLSSKSHLPNSPESHARSRQ